MSMFNHLKGKKLYRSPKDALIFGIAAGMAYYLQVDVVFVRLVLVALAFLTGWWPMFFVYIVGVVLMPIDPAQDTVPSNQEPKDVTPPATEPKPEEPKHEQKASQAESMDSGLNM